MPQDVVRRSGLFQAVSGRSNWQPALDIYELRDGWLLKADLAGVRPDEVTISLSGRTVTIRGYRRDHVIEEGCCHYRMEISYSRFERAVELPRDPGEARLQTEFRDGMLLIRIRAGTPSS